MEKYQLKQLIQKVISGVWGKEDTSNDGVYIIRTANFGKAGKIDYSKLVKRIIDEKKIVSKRLKTGDIIIEKSGGGPKTPVGRVVFFEQKDEEIYLCNNFTATLRPNRELVYPKYLFYLLSYLYEVRFVQKHQNFTVGLVNLRLDRYFEEEVEIHSLVEQSKIVATLNKIQELIDKRVQTIEYLDEYIRSVFLEMFGDPVLNSKGFKQLPLSNKAFGLTSGITPDRKVIEYFGGKVHWAKSTDVKGMINSTQETITDYALKETTAKVFPKNSILIAMYGQGKTRGKVGFLNIEASCNQACAVILPNDKVSALYVFNQLKYSYLYLRSLSKGGNQKNLSLTILKQVNIHIPPIYLQEKFKKLYKNVEEQKQRYQQSLKFLNELFQANLQNAFSSDAAINEEAIFGDILKDLTIEDLKQGKRIEYLLNGLKEGKFDTRQTYEAAIEKLLKLLEDGSIKQFEQEHIIQLKKS